MIILAERVSAEEAVEMMIRHNDECHDGQGTTHGRPQEIDREAQRIVYIVFCLECDPPDQTDEEEE